MVLYVTCHVLISSWKDLVAQTMSFIQDLTKSYSRSWNNQLPLAHSSEVNLSPPLLNTGK